MPSWIESPAILFDNTQYYVRPEDASSNVSMQSVEKKGDWDFEVFVSESSAPELTLSSLNPVFPEIPKKFTKTDLERLRDFFETLIFDYATKEDI